MSVSSIPPIDVNARAQELKRHAEEATRSSEDPSGAEQTTPTAEPLPPPEYSGPIAGNITGRPSEPQNNNNRVTCCNDQSSKAKEPTRENPLDTVRSIAQFLPKLLRLGADLTVLEGQSGVTTETRTETVRKSTPEGTESTTTTTRHVVTNRAQQAEQLRRVASGIADSVTELDNGVVKIGDQTFGKEDAKVVGKALELYLGDQSPLGLLARKLFPKDKTELKQNLDLKHPYADLPTVEEEQPKPDAPAVSEQDLSQAASFIKSVVDPALLLALKEAQVGDLPPEQLGLLVKEILK